MFGCWNRLLVGCIAFVWMNAVEVGMAQNVPEPTANFPYSRLGLGDFLDPFYAANAGMAGLTATIHDPFHLNTLNPAAHGWLRTTSFETGIYSKYAQLNSQGQSNGVWDGNLSYMALGFPLINPINESLDRKESNFGWGTAVSLAPYSLVNYDIELRTPLTDSLASIGTFRGTGGTYKFNLGNGFRYKTFSAGFNVAYFFGRINNTRLVRLEDQLTYFANDFSDAINVNGMVWNIGLAYDVFLKKTNSSGERVYNGKRLSFGFYGNTNSRFITKSDRLYKRVYALGSSNLPLSLRNDTIVSVLNLREEGTLPAAFGLGAMYEKGDKIKIGVEYSATFWNNYVSKAQNDQLSNSYRIALGGQYIPDYASFNSYLKRVRYRFGIFYETDPRSFNGTQLERLAFTTGLGLPIILPRQQTSFVNVAFELGQFGVTEGILERYVKCTLGFTLNDNTWFFKRKFN